MSAPDQTQALKDKVQNILDNYEERLTSAGIKITVSKRYFEMDVRERTSYSPDAAVRLLSNIDRYIDKKRERKYKHAKNKYHCLILSVLPIDKIDKNLVRKEYCKEYAFVLHKTERAHTGQEPQPFTYREDKLLPKIEKRILKIIRKAEKHGAQKMCKDTVPDAIRYLSSTKYAYKNKVLGRERTSWDLAFAFGLVALAVVLILAVWGISRLF